MDEDWRVKDAYTLLREEDEKRFALFFDNNPFSEISQVIDWLAKQLLKRLTSGNESIKITFSPQQFPQTISQLFKDGDIFFDSLFKDQGFIPKESENLRIKTPLTQAVNHLYNSIWSIQNNSRSHELMIYFEFRKFIEWLLGKCIALDSSFSSLSDWESIYEVTRSFYDFYLAWIKNIPVSSLERSVGELIEVNPSSKLSELASLIGLSHDSEKVAIGYGEKLISFMGKSDWEYVRELTRNSDLILLEENLILKEHLLLRLDLKHWLSWLDKLKFPILQDHCFFSIKEFDPFEKIIRIIVDHPQSFKTKSEHLLLIALKNYNDFIEKVSSNLFNLKVGNWNHDKRKDESLIIETARVEYDNWIATGIRSAFENVLNIIFPSALIFPSSYFVGVFNWINSYSKENIISNHNYEPRLKTLEIISELFQKRLNDDTSNKLKILDLGGPETNNWQVFEKFIGLYENDESDEQFRVKLFNRYLDYLRSDYFSWNISLDYNTVVINEASHLAYLLSHFPDPLKEWTALFAEFKCWHEGWKAVEYHDYKMVRKELYVIFTGACITYCLYKEGKTLVARTVFTKVLKATLSQYRISVSFSKEYRLSLRFLSYLATKFDPGGLDDFTIVMLQNTDDIESLLVIIGEIISTAKDEGINLGDPIRGEIRKQIADFCQIEKRYGENVMKNHLDYYSNLKQQILNYLNPNQ